MVQLSIKLLPDSGSNQYTYKYGDLLVQVKLGREFRLKADYSFVVYSDSLRLMTRESTWRQNYWHNAWRAGRTISMTMSSSGALWMPGKYFFLMATKDGGPVIRFDLELDENGRFTVCEPHRCEPLSDEDVLAHQVFESAELWNKLCDFAGMAQLRRKTLEWLKDNAASSNGDAPNYNLLVTCDCETGIDWYPFDVSHHVAYRCVAQMLILTVPGLRIRIGDCSQLCKPAQENPHRLLDVFFDKENPFYDDTFDMEDHVNYWLWNSPYRNDENYDSQQSTFVYVLYNAIDLDENAWNRLHEVMQEERHYIIFCDFKDTIETVMEREPSLKEYYPEENHIALEEATPEEVIRRVFSSSNLNVTLTAAAVDKVCRLLVKESVHRGLGLSASYAERLSELGEVYACNSDDETVIDADDIDEGEFLA